MVKVTFKYKYVLMDGGQIITFNAGDSKEFPDESKHLETFRHQTDVVTIEEVKKKKKK